MSIFSRREFLQVAVATAAMTGAGSLGMTRLAAQQRLTEADLLGFEPLGNVSLVHLTDIHAQIKPILFREPSVNLGIGEVNGLPPHITGEDFLKAYNIEPGTPHAYALTTVDFVSLAQSYGKLGGLDRIATVLKSIRAERGAENTLFLDGGDTW
ncbi:MAG: thiosulfohydrolase SoxB, partial [Hyphomicrobiales bacterium]|nr:thiosulfohydrolase SoxB [Hyphomicrobiales bacterium]